MITPFACREKERERAKNRDAENKYLDDEERFVRFSSFENIFHPVPKLMFISRSADTVSTVTDCLGREQGALMEISPQRPPPPLQGNFPARVGGKIPCNPPGGKFPSTPHVQGNFPPPPMYKEISLQRLEGNFPVTPLERNFSPIPLLPCKEILV